MLGTLNSILACTIVLGLVHVLLAATLITANRGLQWNMGNRDGEPPPLPLHAARAKRASWNFLETFAFFAAAVVCAIAISRDGSQAVLGAQIYFWARVIYLPVYIIGIPVVRSVVWAVSLVGLLMVVLAII